MDPTVRLSTFLELKDNLTPSLSAVNKELNKTNDAAKKVTASLDSMGRLRDASGRHLKKGTEEHTAALASLGEAAASVSSTVEAIGEKAQEAGDRFSSLKELGSSLSGAFTAGGAGSLAAMVAFGKAAIDINREFENTSIRIAGTLKAFDMTPTFDAAKRQTVDILSTIQSLAAALPGETEDYITVFAQALPKAISSGMKDIKSVADFTSRYTAVAVSNTVDAQQAGMDLFRMLAGQAGSDVRMWTVLAEKIGMDAKEFNKLASDVRQAKLDQAIKAFDDQLTAAGDTFDAKFGEMQSRIKEIVQLGSRPLFLGIKNILSDINKRLADNKDTLRATVALISEDMLKKLRYFVDHVSEIGDKLETAYNIGKAFIGLWVASTTVNSITSLVTGFKAVRDAVIAANVAASTGGLSTLINVGPLFVSKLAALTTLAGVGTFLYSKPAGESELAWEENQKKLQQYNDIIAMVSEKTAGAPKALVDMPGTIAELYSNLTKKMTEAPLSKEGSEEISRQRTRLLEYAELIGVDKTAVLPAPKETPQERTKVVNDFRYSRFDIRQEFAEGFDPDRIAVAFATDLGKLADRKLSAATGGPAVGAH